MFGLNNYMLIALGVILFGFTSYFLYSQHVIKSLNKQAVTYEISIEQQKKTIDSLKVDVELIKRLNTELASINTTSSVNAAKLADTLTKLERTATTRPTLVEHFINEAVKDRNRCFEIATGSQITEKDEKNRVCPHFVKR